MSNSNLPKLASSAPTSFLQCTPPSVLLVKSTFPQISSFSPFPPSPNQQLQQFLSHIFLLTSHPVLWVPALLIYTASFSSLVLGLTKETASPPSSKVRASLGCPLWLSRHLRSILAASAPNPQSAGDRLSPACSLGLKLVQGLSYHCKSTPGSARTQE